MPVNAIAVDLDDTLNHFTEMLQTGDFRRTAGEALPEERYQEYLQRVRQAQEEESELLSTEYTYFRARIHLQCFAQCRVREGAVEFMQWLRGSGYRIVICTQRDLRRSHDLTRSWLERHGMPFDHLFNAANKIAFCGLWRIPLLIDDDRFAIEHGRRYGVQVFYPLMGKHAGAVFPPARGFASFAELQTWITG